MKYNSNWYLQILLWNSMTNETLRFSRSLLYQLDFSIKLPPHYIYKRAGRKLFLEAIHQYYTASHRCTDQLCYIVYNNNSKWYYALWSMFYVLCSMFYVLCSMFYVACSVFYVQCSLLCVLCSMFLSSIWYYGNLNYFLLVVINYRVMARSRYQVSCRVAELPCCRVVMLPSLTNSFAVNNLNTRTLTFPTWKSKLRHTIILKIVNNSLVIWVWIIY